MQCSELKHSKNIISDVLFCRIIAYRKKKQNMKLNVKKYFKRFKMTQM